MSAAHRIISSMLLYPSQGKLSNRSPRQNTDIAIFIHVIPRALVSSGRISGPLLSWIQKHEQNVRS